MSNEPAAPDQPEQPARPDQPAGPDLSQPMTDQDAVTPAVPPRRTWRDRLSGPRAHRSGILIGIGSFIAGAVAAFALGGLLQHGDDHRGRDGWADTSSQFGERGGPGRGLPGGPPGRLPGAPGQGEDPDGDNWQGGGQGGLPAQPNPSTTPTSPSAAAPTT